MSKIVQSSGKRRTAIARARLMEVENEEDAVIRVNGVLLDHVKPKFARLRMMEPLLLAQDYHDGNISIKIRVKGGGVQSRGEAVRMAIARGLDEYLGLKEVREIFENYDRTMISGDVRRTESKKFGGPGARARYQKSYR